LAPLPDGVGPAAVPRGQVLSRCATTAGPGPTAAMGTSPAIRTGRNVGIGSESDGCSARSRSATRALRRAFSTALGRLVARGSGGIAPRLEAAAPLAGDPLPRPGRDLGVGVLPIPRERAQVPTQGRLDLGEVRKPQRLVHAPQLADRVPLQILEAD